MKRRRCEISSFRIEALDWNALPEDTTVIICSFCNLIDILALQCSCRFFRINSLNEIKQRKVISFSSLIQNSPCEPSSKKKKHCNAMKISYRLTKDRQEMCVNKILHEVLDRPQRRCHCQRMDFCNMRNISSLSLSLQHMKQLLSLDLSFCSSLDPDLLMDVVGAGRTAAPPLQELYLTGCRKIKDTHVSRLVQFFSKIKVLHLSGCSQTIDDACIENICNLRDLQALDLMGFNRITDRSSLAIFSRAKTLQYLNVDKCEKLRWGFLYPLSDRLSRWFSRSQPEEIIDACCLAMTGDSSQIRSMEPFTSVNMDLFSFKLQCANISFGPSSRGGLQPNMLAALSFSCFGRLRELNVSGSRIVDDDIKVLTFVCKNSLRSLEISCCDKIGDESLRYISQHSENIVDLDISACFKMSDLGVARLASCLQLSALKASSLGNVTDQSISCLTSLKNLVLLDLHDCLKVSQSSIKILLKELPNLVDVDVRNISFSSPKIDAEDKKCLSIFNGKKCCAVTDSFDQFRDCSVHQSSQRVTKHQGAQLRRMYHCKECNLLPKFGKGMCMACAKHCHKDHDGVYLGAVTFFYCDCAFGFSSKECRLMKHGTLRHQ